MGKKICIITFHRSLNYGAVLQAYALQKFLCYQENEAIIIDFRPKYLENLYNIFTVSGQNFKSLIYKIGSLIINFDLVILHKKKFDDFIYSDMCINNSIFRNLKDLQQNPPIADVYICGSDQIWNPEITCGFEPAYFLQFGGQTIKRIAYAASFGKTNFNQTDIEFIKKNISNINFVSIRESTGKDFLKSFSNQEIEWVLDPIFLLNPVLWNQISINSNFHDYLLIYSLENNNLLHQIAKKIAFAKKLKIVLINNSRIPMKNIHNAKKIGPKEFIGLLTHASYIVTNSFHGTAFAIIFNKQFVTVPHSTRNSRIFCLLDKFDLQNRLVISIDNTPDDITVDEFNILNAQLLKECNRSQQWLIDSINKG